MISALNNGPCWSRTMTARLLRIEPLQCLQAQAFLVFGGLFTTQLKIEIKPQCLSSPVHRADAGQASLGLARRPVCRSPQTSGRPSLGRPSVDSRSIFLSISKHLSHMMVGLCRRWRPSNLWPVRQFHRVHKHTSVGVSENGKNGVLDAAAPSALMCRRVSSFSCPVRCYS